jgi:hypothetical protein
MKKTIYTLFAILGFANFTMAQYTVTSGIEKYILLEAAVGSSNSSVPSAYTTQASLRRNYPNLIIINNHNNYFGGTPLKFSTIDQWNSTYISPIYPRGTIDRVQYQGSMSMSNGVWTNAIIDRDITPKYQVSITIEKIGEQLKVIVIGKALTNLTGEYRFNVMITEDSLIQNQASTSGTLTNFSHNDVLKAYLGSEWGIYKCSNPILNQIDSMTFNYIIPKITVCKNLKVIGLVQKYSVDSTQREIMNAVATQFSSLTSYTNKTDEGCSGKVNGSITVNTYGGNSPYIYSINNGAYQTSNKFNNLFAGIYVSKVKDASNVFIEQIDTINVGNEINVGEMHGPIIVAPNVLSNYIVGQKIGFTYLWNATNGIIATGQGTNLAQISWGSASGNGKVKVIAYSAGGCIDSTSLNIIIGSTGISSASPIVNSLKVYPNPASTLLYIDLEKPGYFIAKLSSITGQSIITPTSGTIDISSLANGVYILTIYDSNNKLISTNKVAIVR